MDRCAVDFVCVLLIYVNVTRLSMRGLTATTSATATARATATPQQQQKLPTVKLHTAQSTSYQRLSYTPHIRQATKS